MASAASSEMVFCRGCAGEIHFTARTCPKCGAKARPGTAKSKGVAALLAFLLGGLGAHHFYLGHPGRAILYVLFCWTFIPAIVAFFECIYFLCKDQAAWDAVYG